MDTKTKNKTLNFLANSQSPNLTKLGMVIENVEHVLAP